MQAHLVMNVAGSAQKELGADKVQVEIVAFENAGWAYVRP
jgi:hypothetical protein